MTYHSTRDKAHNADETGVRNVQKSSIFLAQKARKRVGTAVRWERERCTTGVCVCVCVSVRESE